MTKVITPGMMFIVKRSRVIFVVIFVDESNVHFLNLNGKKAYDTEYRRNFDSFVKHYFDLISK